jgi:hypothetical protein
LLVGLVGSAGTYAEYVAVSADPPLARVPDDGGRRCGATSGRLHRTRAVVESLEPLGDKTVLIVGAGGGVGYFVTQFGVNAGALVIANEDCRCGADARIRRHGNCLAGATGRQGRAQCGRSPGADWRQSHGTDFVLHGTSELLERTATRWLAVGSPRRRSLASHSTKRRVCSARRGMVTPIARP